ncbi:thioredoxin family protein [Paenibacillus macerans]|uniref:thioredoxin family protein n=1 Tax=Paenibacillus macerans TaxID=44252 RepID=UPI00203CE585|nr:thioredoxin family protein [Paenibacillus macerans]MCM3701755.1 thioredoxin family protein [Paenibacillus macerans]
MEIRETTEQEWLDRAEQTSGKEALFFFTALCGTCKLAEKMLDIALAAGPSIPVSKLNINYSPRLRDQWEISSVPCLIVLQDGQPMQKEYAMRSVVDLREWLKV